MTKKSKILIIAICAVLLIAVGYGGYRIWCHSTYDDALFDRSYAVSRNLYGDMQANYFGNTPEYALSSEGVLYKLDYSGANVGYRKLTGAMKSIDLTEENFDALFADGTVLSKGAELASVREQNQQAWHYPCQDGRMYYVLHQNNGDVILAMGKDGQLGGMYLLASLGDADVFFAHIREQ